MNRLTRLRVREVAVVCFAYGPSSVLIAFTPNAGLILALLFGYGAPLVAVGQHWITPRMPLLAMLVMALAVLCGAICWEPSRLGMIGPLCALGLMNALVVTRCMRGAVCARGASAAGYARQRGSYCG